MAPKKSIISDDIVDTKMPKKPIRPTKEMPVVNDNDVITVEEPIAPPNTIMPIVDTPKKARKPRAKKDTNTTTEVKERKTRIPTEYNIFMGQKMKELREKHKNDTEKLKATEYLKMAVIEWKVYKESKVTNA